MQCKKVIELDETEFKKIVAAGLINHMPFGYMPGESEKLYSVKTVSDENGKIKSATITFADKPATVGKVGVAVVPENVRIINYE